MNISVMIPASDFVTRLQAARLALATEPDSHLEQVARRHGLSLRDVLALLPAAQACKASGRRFVEIWDEVSGWGRIVFATSDAHGAFEMTTQLRPGRTGRSLFNLFGAAPPHGSSSERCGAIWLVDRRVSGLRSCTLIFLDQTGAVLFKILLRRNAEGEPDGDQLIQFEAMKAMWRLIHGSPPPCSLVAIEALPRAPRPWAGGEM